jgi:uncharacterized phiE125 gp8 family phage protein
MSPILIAPPAVEPVSLADAKLYLRIDGPDEDELLSALITASRLLVEAASGRLMIAQTWRLVLDAWPAGGALRLPFSPVTSITGARTFDATGNATAMPAGLLSLTPGEDPAVLRLDDGPPPPGRRQTGIEIDLICGFGPAAADVPAPLRQAVLRLVARWFENRGDDVQGVDARLPADVMALIAPYRRARL